MKTLCTIIAMALIAVVSYGQATLSADVVVNSKTNIFTSAKGKVVTDYSSSKIECWRFVHNGKALVLEPYFTGSTTYTPHKIVECKTLQLAIESIIALKLTMTDDQKREIESQAKSARIDLAKLGWTVLADK